ncbi:sterile alpha motif domain-containing protein 1 [Corythoichthys intestinalis]|uniref:sterile alpha motif domain-containing protein 1 n=1 Tax=Corythoichthys intestinalis TaxID=161448 RepID=UPI0025A59AF1|nr:sterile alpha motif domain-containing protein 1 [Corythoichthys intestinalis]
MSGPNKYGEWILETIDSLRSRKARPDLERICRMVRRRHGSDPDRTRVELEKLIQEQTVLKVSYKGSISYRNAAKVQRKSRKKIEDVIYNNSSNGDSALSFTDQEDDSEPSPSRLQTAAGKQHASPGSPRSVASASHGDALGREKPAGDDTRNQTYKHTVAQQSELPGWQSDPGDPLGQGQASVRSLSEKRLQGTAAPVAAATKGPVKPLGLKEILGYLSNQEERFSEEKLTRGKVKVVMEREVARGRLRKTRCGNITLPLRGMTTTKASAGSLTLQPAIKESEPMEEDDVQEDSEEEENPRSSNEEAGLSLIAMATTAALVEKASEEREIQKPSEKESVCRHPNHDKDASSVTNPRSMTGCSPPLDAPASMCITAFVQERPATPNQLPMDIQSQIQHTQSSFIDVECKTEVGVSSCLLTPTASPRETALPEEQGTNGEVNNGECIKIEGVKGSPMDWTVSDVVSYFTTAGFPEQATAFGAQEIDGKSLLLMQRNDVLTGLSIRLGPALKIYERHVKVLQKTHFDDVDST